MFVTRFPMALVRDACISLFESGADRQRAEHARIGREANARAHQLNLCPPFRVGRLGDV